MRFTRLSIPGTILALSLIGPTLGACGEKAPIDSVTALTAVEQWRTKSLDHSAQVVVLRETSCRRSIQRLLVSLDTGHRFVLDREHVPSEGLERMKLTEDHSGWWVQWTRNSELHIETRVPWDFARLPELYYAHRDEEWGVELSLSASGLEPFNMSSTNTEAGFEHRFFAQADFDGRTITLVEQMPAVLQGGIGFLRSMLDSEQGRGSGFMTFQPLVEFLAHALERHGDPEAQRTHEARTWELVEDDSRFVAKATRFAEGDLPSGVELFETFADPTDPLAGRHVSVEDCR